MECIRSTYNQKTFFLRALLHGARPTLIVGISRRSPFEKDLYWYNANSRECELHLLFQLLYFWLEVSLVVENLKKKEQPLNVDLNLQRHSVQPYLLHIFYS